jgi:hypothetical protein
MLEWLVGRRVRLALDGRVFRLEEAREAFERVQKGEHFAKVVIKIA